MGKYFAKSSINDIKTMDVSNILLSVGVLFSEGIEGKY